MPGVAVLVSLLALPVTATAHTAGSCALDRPHDRCERWSRTYDDPSVAAPARSDQFVSATAASSDTAYVAVKNTRLNTEDPYSSSGSSLLQAYDLATGELRWQAERRSRHYDMPLDVAVSPDERVVYLTGAAYAAYVISSPNDSHVVTLAYDAATGEELWARTWDARPDGTDNGKVLTISPDGREVYVGGITTGPGDDLDYLVVAYDARRGRELWSTTWDGPPGATTDALFDIGVAGDGRHVHVTGYSFNPANFDYDYVTLALRTTKRAGSVHWIGRYDGGRQRSDRAWALAVAPDGTVAVTGDSYDEVTGDFDTTTVAYDGSTGAQRWATRSAGAHGGFNSADGIVATADRIIVSGQSNGADSDSGHDTATTAYDLTTGTPLWTHREEHPRSSELPSSLALSPDGEIAYVATSARPVIDYTSLNELVLHAYRTSDGTGLWSSRLDVGPGNALAARGLAVSPTGPVLVTGQTTLSQDPLGPETQNRYDAFVAVFEPR